jgi:hypothetical protein
MSGLGVSTRYSHQMEVADVNSAPVLAPDVSNECQHQGSTPNVSSRWQHQISAPGLQELALNIIY